jgi:16S rRNA (adenine1518-N6/adenine1519-N6)-dimethyltransferase
VENFNLLQRAKHLLRLYDVSPKKRLGQHFTVDMDLLQRLVSCASITKDDVVLEVGAGLGFLTQILSRECKKVIAVEVDPTLVKILKKQLHELQNVDLIEGDILEVSFPKFNKESKFDWAVLILQKEFAERLGGSVGTKDYGRLTVTIYYRADVELLDSVPRKMFYPPPDVDSLMLRLKPREPPFQVEDENFFFELVQVLFTQRNKKVRNALIPFLRKREMNRKEAVEWADSTIYRAKRVRELAPEDFGILTNELLRKFMN